MTELWEDTQLPAHDIEAERYTLACMMASPQAIADCTEVVTPEDFLRPAHRIICNAMISMFAANEPVTPVTLRDWISRDGDHVDPLYLFELHQLPVVSAMGPSHARIVWDQAVRRNIELAGRQLSSLAARRDESPSGLLAEAQKTINQSVRGAVRSRVPAMSVGEFLAITGRSVDPVIPGLLDHQDRVIVVGGEGTGKTTLAHQVGFALAAGQHPFAQSDIPPGKTLIVDLENPIEILKRRFRKLAALAEMYPGWQEDNLSILAKPGGVDLTNPVHAYSLAEVIREKQPDLLILGPLYKCLPGGEVNEHHHATVCRFFDVARERYDCAVWLETHAPMQSSNGERQMRPLGSGVYSRWPEFGISLTRDSRQGLRLARFRGDREEGRMWPDKLVRSSHGVAWPWSAVYPPGTFNP